MSTMDDSFCPEFESTQLSEQITTTKMDVSSHELSPRKPLLVGPNRKTRFQKPTVRLSSLEATVTFAKVGTGAVPLPRSDRIIFQQLKLLQTRDQVTTKSIESLQTQLAAAQAEIQSLKTEAILLRDDLATSRDSERIAAHAARTVAAKLARFEAARPVSPPRAPAQQASASQTAPAQLASSPRAAAQRDISLRTAARVTKARVSSPKVSLSQAASARPASPLPRAAAKQDSPVASPSSSYRIIFENHAEPTPAIASAAVAPSHIVGQQGKTSTSPPSHDPRSDPVSGQHSHLTAQKASESSVPSSAALASPAAPSATAALSAPAAAAYDIFAEGPWALPPQLKSKPQSESRAKAPASQQEPTSKSAPLPSDSTPETSPISANDLSVVSEIATRDMKGLRQFLEHNKPKLHQGPHRADSAPASSAYLRSMETKYRDARAERSAPQSATPPTEPIPAQRSDSAPASSACMRSLETKYRNARLEGNEPQSSTLPAWKPSPSILPEEPTSPRSEDTDSDCSMSYDIGSEASSNLSLHNEPAQAAADEPLQKSAADEPLQTSVAEDGSAKNIHDSMASVIVTRNVRVQSPCSADYHYYDEPSRQSHPSNSSDKSAACLDENYINSPKRRGDHSGREAPPTGPASALLREPTPPQQAPMYNGWNPANNAGTTFAPMFNGWNPAKNTGFAPMQNGWNQVGNNGSSFAPMQMQNGWTPAKNTGSSFAISVNADDSINLDDPTDASIRPSQPPVFALETVLNELQAEVAAKKKKVRKYQEYYDKRSPGASREKRHAVMNRITLLMADIEHRSDQIYNLTDVLEGQTLAAETAAPQMTEADVDNTLDSMGLKGYEQDDSKYSAAESGSGRKRYEKVDSRRTSAAESGSLGGYENDDSRYSAAGSGSELS